MEQEQVAPLFAPITSAYAIAEPGIHPVTIIRIDDLGMAKSDFTNKDEHWIKVVFQVDDQRDEGTQPVLLPWKVTLKINPLSTLMKLLKPLGILIDFKAGGSFDVQSLVGRTIFAKVKHRRKGNVTYGDIVEFMTQPSGSRRQIATVIEYGRKGTYARTN